jgi:hypothetical protein
MEHFGSTSHTLDQTLIKKMNHKKDDLSHANRSLKEYTDQSHFPGI